LQDDVSSLSLTHTCTRHGTNAGKIEPEIITVNNFFHLLLRAAADKDAKREPYPMNLILELAHRKRDPVTRTLIALNRRQELDETTDKQQDESATATGQQLYYETSMTNASSSITSTSGCGTAPASSRIGLEGVHEAGGHLSSLSITSACRNPLGACDKIRVDSGRKPLADRIVDATDARARMDLAEGVKCDRSSQYEVPFVYDSNNTSSRLIEATSASLGQMNFNQPQGARSH
jgi:hypothetical protein